MPIDPLVGGLLLMLEERARRGHDWEQEARAVADDCADDPSAVSDYLLMRWRQQCLDDSRLAVQLAEILSRSGVCRVGEDAVPHGLGLGIEPGLSGRWQRRAKRLVARLRRGPSR